MNYAAASSFAYVGSSSSNVARYGSQTNTVSSNPTFVSKTNYSSVEDLQMPKRLNPHDNGLCRSLRLQEQWEREEYKNAESM